MARGHALADDRRRSAGFIVALVTVFKKTWAPVTAPLYAVLEGLFLGGISAMFEAALPGHRDAGGRADLRHAVRAARWPTAAA